MPNTEVDMPEGKVGYKKSLGKNVLHTSKDYASVATAHGLSYIGNEEQSLGDRMLWVLIVVLAISFTIFQMSTLYKQWQNSPVITTLDTVALPIEKIRFPAITICPQGSLEDILDSVLFKQLKEYIRNRNLTGHSRSRRSVVLDEQIMTYEEMMNMTKEFLNEIYPGVTDKPIELVRLMLSDDPKRTLRNQAILYPKEECDQSSNVGILNTLNQQLNKEVI